MFSMKSMNEKMRKNRQVLEYPPQTSVGLRRQEALPPVPRCFPAHTAAKISILHNFDSIKNSIAINISFVCFSAPSSL